MSDGAFNQECFFLQVDGPISDKWQFLVCHTTVNICIY